MQNMPIMHGNAEPVRVERCYHSIICRLVHSHLFGIGQVLQLVHRA